MIYYIFWFIEFAYTILPYDRLGIVIIYLYFITYAANSGQDCEKEFGLR